MNTFETTDITLATTLNIYGFQLEIVLANPPKKCKFIFPASFALSDIIKKFWNGELTVEPIHFSQMLRHFKSRIYDITKQQSNTHIEFVD